MQYPLKLACNCACPRGAASLRLLSLKRGSQVMCTGRLADFDAHPSMRALPFSTFASRFCGRDLSKIASGHQSMYQLKNHPGFASN